MGQGEEGAKRKKIMVGGTVLTVVALVASSLMGPAPKSPFDISTGKYKAALKKQDYTGALQFAEKRVGQAQKKFPPEAPQISEAIYDQGTVLALQGKHEEAVELLERAVALDIKFRGISDTGLGRKMVALAESKEKLGDLGTASRYAIKASAILEGDRSERLLKYRAKADLIQVHALLQSQDCASASELAVKGIVVVNKSLRKENDLLLGFSTAAGKAAQCQGDIAQAEAYISDAVSVARRLKSEELPGLMSLQGELLCQLGKCKRGVKLQEKGYKVAQKLFGEGTAKAASFAPTIDLDEVATRGSLARNVASAAEDSASPATEPTPDLARTAEMVASRHQVPVAQDARSKEGVLVPAPDKTQPPAVEPLPPPAQEPVVHRGRVVEYEAF